MAEIAPGYIVTGEILETSTATIPSGEAPQKVEEPKVTTHPPAMPEVEMVDIGGGVMKPRKEAIGTKVANSDKFKTVILGHKHFLDKNGKLVRKHFDNYLMKYFGLNSPANLTWGMFVAMRNHIDGKSGEPSGFLPEAKKESEPKTPADKIVSVAELLPLISRWREDYKQTVGAESPDFLEQIDNVLTGVDNGFFATGTPEGLKEIDEAFRLAMKSDPL